MAQIRSLKDIASGEVFFPATIGDAVAVCGKKLTSHIKRLEELDDKVGNLESRVTTLEERTTWSKWS